MVARAISLQRIQARQAARDKLAEFVNWTHLHPSPTWVFRGQSSKWPLKPSIGRIVRYRPEAEVALLDEFKRAAIQFMDRAALQNQWDLLAVAQHYGLPTRLIDWTTNALVAAYFASQHSPYKKRDGEIIAVQARAVGFYRPDDQAKIDPLSIQKEGFIYTPAVATRIIAQRGLFSIHPHPTRPWRLRNQTDRFTIPAAMKSDFQRSLFSMGVDAAFLMADLDGLAQTLKWRLKNGALGT